MPESNGGHKAIIVAGGASGIGFATVKRLLANWPDVKVIAADIHLGVLEEFQKEIGTDRLLILKSDITSAEGAAQVIKESAQ